MTTQITAKAFHTYESPILTRYTGTSDQPDAVSLFFKDKNNSVSVEDEALINQYNYHPLNFMEAIVRIQEAGYRIFLYMKGEDNDLCNACANMTRGVIALVPLAGNGVLYLYDTVKAKFYTHPQIAAALEGQAGPVLGIAFDGKIVATIPLEKFNAAMKANIHEPLPVLTYTWLSYISKIFEKEIPNMTRAKVAELLSKKINEARLFN